MTKKRKIPAWPETLRVVMEEWSWSTTGDTTVEFNSLQPGQKPLSNVLGIATYRLDKPEKKRRKR